MSTNIFQKGLKKGLSFTTPKGVFGMEKIYRLNTPDLKTTGKSYYERTRNESVPDFLQESVDSDDKLKYKIIKAILLERTEDENKRLQSVDKKKWNDQVNEDIEAAKRRERAGMSVEELEKLKK